VRECVAVCAQALRQAQGEGHRTIKTHAQQEETPTARQLGTHASKYTNTYKPVDRKTQTSQRVKPSVRSSHPLLQKGHVLSVTSLTSDSMFTPMILF